MLGFLSPKEKNDEKVTKEQIYFVSCSDSLTDEQIKVNFSKIALSFAQKLNLNKVFLHFGKERKIIYDFKV